MIVRVVGAKAHSIRYTLGHHTLGRRRRAPFNFVLYGYAPARSEAVGPRVRLVARNANNGRVLGIARLRRTWKPVRQSKTPNPHVSFTSTPARNDHGDHEPRLVHDQERERHDAAASTARPSYCAPAP